MHFHFHFRFLFLIPEGILLYFFVAPIFKRICNPGNLAGILVCLLLIFLTIFPKKVFAFLQSIWQHLPGKIGLSLLAAVTAAGVLFCTVMSIQMARTISTKPDGSQNVVVVLGCKVRGTTPSLMLRRRLKAAEEYLTQHPDAVCVVTGGQGAGEDIPEGQAMKNWLVENGIAEERIYAETTSRDTQENLENAAEILVEHQLGSEIVIVTDGFHEYRASLLAERAGLQSSAYSAKTRALFVPTYWVREWMALFQLIVLGHG